MLKFYPKELQCSGAKINGKLMPISYVLKNGDQIDIITSPKQKPKKDWLDFVITSKAKSRIKAALNSDKNEKVAEGKEILQRKLRHAKINFSEDEINNIQKYLNLKTSQELFLKFYDNTLDTSDLKRYSDSKKSIFKNIFQSLLKKKNEFIETQKSDLDLIVFGRNEEKLNYSFAKCCSVIPGDKIFGFLTINEGIKVHNENCPNSINLRANYDYRIMLAKWVNSERFINNVKIEIQGMDRLGVINDISSVISKNMNIDMKSISLSSIDGIFIGNITLEVKNKQQLEEVLSQLRGITGILSLRRL